MATREERLAILKQVESGELTIEEGSRRLQMLESGETMPPAGAPAAEPERQASKANEEAPSSAEPVEDVRVLDPPAAFAPVMHYAWLFILMPGVILTVLSAYWMYLGWLAAGQSWGFWLSWIPLALGIFLIVLGWQLSTAPWLHVRIQQKPGNHPSIIRFSIPVPFHLAGWALRISRPWLPYQVREMELEGMLSELKDSVTADNPMQIQVDEGGEKVELYLG